MTDGLVLSVNSGVNATIGNGTSSVTTIAGTLTMGSTAFVNNSGVVQVATQGTIDHDSLANFVANEHLRWDNDVSSTATIHASNIPTLNQNTTGSAATLTTTRAFQTDLASTSSVNFNGSAANTHGVTGTLAVGNGGTGNTSGNATGLVASTSNSIGVGSIELGHADDTTIARSAAGKITVEGKEVRTVDRNIQIIHSSFRDDIGTTAHYVPWHSTSEKTTNTNEEIPFVAPYAGKLLELHYRTSKNTSGATATWELVQILKTETVAASNNTTLDTQTCTGPTNDGAESDNSVTLNTLS